MNEFDINNLAFEIYECAQIGELTTEFKEAWSREWVRVKVKQRYSVKGTTVLGDTFEYNRFNYITINNKIVYAYDGKRWYEKKDG